MKSTMKVKTSKEKEIKANDKLNGMYFMVLSTSEINKNMLRLLGRGNILEK